MDMQNNKEGTSLNEQQRSFLNKRGITDKVIDAFSIATADVPLLRLSNAIQIPINHIDGAFFFNKYRRNPLEGNVTPKYLYDRGGKVTLYGADKLVAEFLTRMPMDEKSVTDFSPTKPTVVITEGELDTLVCWSLGIPAVSSTGGAMSFQKEWCELLKNYEVFICFDNDEAGHRGAIKVLELLPNSRVIFIPRNIPDVKDISDYVSRGGDFHALMKTAKTYTSVEDVEVEREEIAANWGDYSFHDLYIEKHKVLAMPTDVSGKAKKQMHDKTNKMECAKAVPCTDIAGVEWVRRGKYLKTKCLWHNDSDPSLTYYPEPKNNTYCHSCGKYADGIDIVQALHFSNLSAKEGFLKAVDYLTK